MRTLANLYDADMRVRDAETQRIAANYPIPHPLNNVQYADGISRCRHSKTHGQHDNCRQEFRPSTQAVPR